MTSLLIILAGYLSAASPFVTVMAVKMIWAVVGEKQKGRR